VDAAGARIGSFIPKIGSSMKPEKGIQGNHSTSLFVVLFLTIQSCLTQMICHMS